MKAPGELGRHALPFSNEVNLDIRKLAKLRNTFDHFIPGGFSLEVNGLPRIVRNCCAAIEHLTIGEPAFRRRLGNTQRRRVELALSALRKAVDKWELRQSN